MFQHTNTDTKTEAAQSLACSIPQFCSIHKQGKHTPEPFCDQYAEFCYQHPPIPQFNTKTNKRSYTRARVRKDPIILNQIGQTDKQKLSLSFWHTALLNRKTLWSIRKKIGSRIYKLFHRKHLLKNKSSCVALQAQDEQK